MPTYEYRCSKCSHEFELFQSITSKPSSRCPACGRNSAKRLIGAGAGVIFKGSGFYETDYKRSGAGKPCAAKESTAPSGKGGTKAGSEACQGCSKAESCPSSPAAPKD
jgi:putative FmdB family regulatory protein